jgi:integrase
MEKITKRIVDAAIPNRKNYYILWDSSLAGFGLQVLPSGTKSYVYQYRNHENRTKRITIGKHGKLTADQARKKAKKFENNVIDGLDPVELKQARKNALTVGGLFDSYLESAKFAEKAETTRKVDAGRIERHLKPLLGKKIADKLTTDEIRKVSADIETGKTAKTVKTGPRGLARVTGGPGAARMCIRLLKSAYSWAYENHLVKANTPSTIKVGKDGRRDLTLTDSEYKTLFETIEDLENNFQIRKPVADAIRLIALTGARRGEIAGLKWKYVDLKKGFVEIPIGEHKTGKKTGETRIIGLPTVAQEIIVGQASGSPEDYVFPPLNGGGPINLGKPWRLIRKEAGLHPEIGLHGLRHSLATQMAISGSQAAHIMAVMGHKDLSTSQRYIHIAQDIRPDLAEKAAVGISSALTGIDSGDVLSIKKGRA